MTDEETIRRIVKEAVHETLSGLGLDVRELKDMQADMIYLRKERIRSEQVGSKIVMTLVGVIIPASLYVLWENAKRAIKGE